MKKLKHDFDPVASAMHNRSIMLLIVAVFVLFGVYSLVNMPKNEFPSFTIRQGVVVGVYPGATSEEVEQQLTKPLERFLWSFKEIKKSKTYSETKDGMCYVFVELNDNVENKDEFWSKFKLRLQQFKSSLPSGVLALIANDDFGETSARLITIESNTKTYRELHNYVSDLQDRLRTIPELANLRVYGEQQEQIGVYIDRDKLSSYGINSSTLMSVLQSQGLTVVSGSVDNAHTVRPIHLQSRLNTSNDIAQQIVYSDPNGNVIRLRDVATIRREYPDADSYIKNNGKKCVVLSLEMNDGNNIVQFGDKVNNVIDGFKKTLPSDVSIYTITDQSEVVNTSIVEFLKELLIAIFSVVVVIMLLLPMRVASVAASTIPITIFISLALFYSFGIELNTVTLAVLIVTLGMIVDNSIVIIDCYIEKIDSGMSRWHASIAATKEFFSSIFSATLAISITFFPLMLTMDGMLYDFVKWFPIGVTIVLGVSLLVAVLTIPWMQYTFIKSGLKKDEESGAHRKSFLNKIQDVYDKLIDKCFEHPFVTLAVGVGGVALGGLLFACLPQKMMPRAERNQFAVEIYMPEGTAIERTAQVADSLEMLLKKDDRVENITTFYGNGSPRFQAAYAPQLGGSNFAQFIVNTKDDAATTELLDKFTPKYSNYFPDAMVRFKELSYSDAASPIEMRFSGDDLKSLHKAVDAAMAVMRRDTDLLLVRSNFEGTQNGLNVVMNSDEANRLGISKSMLSLNLATRFGNGIPLTSVWEGDYPVDVVLKDSHAGMQNPEDLNNSLVSGFVPSVSVPLDQIATVSPDWHEGMIVRRNGIRTISVYAETQRKVNINELTDRTIKRIKQLKMPEGVTFSVGGQRFSDEETVPKILNGLAISVVIIFVILIFHFKDIRMSVLVMFSLLFSLLGAALGVLVFHQDLSVTGILGIISLMGIIVRNGMIMIDYAEELRKRHHLSAKHAALNAAQRRMRPIFLTSAAASMGVIPMVIQNSPMWGPMGVIVFMGTLVSMLFIITIIPIGYWMIFRIEDKKRHLKDEGLKSDFILNKIKRLNKIES